MRGTIKLLVRHESFFGRCQVDMRGATRKRSRPDRESIQSMLSQHFQPASDRDRVSPAESAFWYHGKCCDDDLGLQTRGRRAFPASAR